MVETENYISEEKVNELLDKEYQNGISIGSSLATLCMLCEIHKDNPFLVRELKILRAMLGEKFDTENK